jgi:arginase
VRDAEAGLVWIDAHADFNTPASSVSGFWPGMTLAVLVGDCGQEVWSALRWRPLAAERVVLFGVRSLSPEAEARRLERSAMQVVRWQNGRAQRDVEDALDRLSQRVRRVYVHLDLDALDPAVGAGVVDPLSSAACLPSSPRICSHRPVAGSRSSQQRSPPTRR